MYKNVCWHYWKKKIHPRAVYLNIFTKYKSSGEFTKSITTALIHNYNVISAHKSGVFFLFRLQQRSAIRLEISPEHARPTDAHTGALLMKKHVACMR
jgi:hypothetical protein